MTSNPGLTFEACAPDPVRQAAGSTHASTTNAPLRRRSDIPARLWQNRNTAWQHAQREQAAKFEAQQILLFGGEPGDDVDLCFRMLEYFGGLDYIS